MCVDRKKRVCRAPTPAMCSSQLSSCPQPPGFIYSLSSLVQQLGGHIACHSNGEALQMIVCYWWTSLSLRVSANHTRRILLVPLPREFSVASFVPLTQTQIQTHRKKSAYPLRIISNPIRGHRNSAPLVRGSTCCNNQRNTLYIYNSKCTNNPSVVPTNLHRFYFYSHSEINSLF